MNPITCYQINITYWYHPDYLGSIEWVTNADGRPVEYFWYSPWGETLQADNSWRGRFSSPFKFTGHIEDEETGLTYAGARYYPARESQWLSVDPLAHKALIWTPYRYGFNNPINIIDPDGLFESKAEAKEWAKENGIKTGWLRNHRIVKTEDKSTGAFSFSIENKKSLDSYTRLSDNDESLNPFHIGDGVFKSVNVVTKPAKKKKGGFYFTDKNSPDHFAQGNSADGIGDQRDLTGFPYGISNGVSRKGMLVKRMLEHFRNGVDFIRAWYEENMFTPEKEDGLPVKARVYVPQYPYRNSDGPYLNNPRDTIFPSQSDLERYQKKYPSLWVEKY